MSIISNGGNEIFGGNGVAGGRSGGVSGNFQPGMRTDITSEKGGR